MIKNKKRLGIKQKIGYTAGVLVVLRILYAIPVPLLDRDYFRELVGSNDSLGMLNVLTGSGLTSLSFMAIGITPYITASIVIQLIAVVSPRIAKIQTSAYTSDQLIYRNIVYKTGVCLGVMESLALALLIGESGILESDTLLARLIIAAAWSLGSLLTLFAAWIINEKILQDGKERGASLIIVTGILSTYPSSVMEIFLYLKDFPLYVAVSGAVLLAALAACLHMASIYMISAEKTLNTSYSRKLSNTAARGLGPDLHLKMLPGTVIPLIFTSTFLTFMSAGLSKIDPGLANVFNMSCWFDGHHLSSSAGILLYVLAVIGFTYYYNSISQPAEKVAEDLKVSGATINGYRPGMPTADLIRKKTKYMFLIGAICLSLLSLIPVLIGSVLHVSGIKFLGSSLLIVTSVLCEIKREISSFGYGRKRRKKDVLAL